VPTEIGECDLVAGGGVAAVMTRKHASIKQPTRIEVLGLLADGEGRTLNIAQFALPRAEAPIRPQLTIAVVGSSMNAGKTTTAAGLVHGLSRAGFRVGAAKITGTGSGADLWTMHDAGAADAMGAAFGTEWLGRKGITSLTLSGLVSASPLAAKLARPDPAAKARAIAGLEREARDLGTPGRDTVFGHGLLEDAR
jgi:hypothetical protein